MRLVSRMIAIAALAGLLAGKAIAADVTPAKPAAPATAVTFAPVIPGKVPTFPEDTGAHPGFRTEWWYATGWLDDPDGKPLGFQITFFRSATGHDPADPSAFAPTQLIIAHAALSDPGPDGRYVHDQKIARQGFGLAFAKTGNTDVKVDAWQLTRAADGHYDVTIDATGFALQLRLTPTQPPLLQGDNGYSRKGPLAEQASYYYSEPQLRVSGSVTRAPLPNQGSDRDGQAEARATNADADTNANTGAVTGRHAGRGVGSVAVTGSAWLDHEWSTTVLSADAVGWDWLGANLRDGTALMAFRVRGAQGGPRGQRIWAHAVLRDAAGRVTNFTRDDVDFIPRRTWRSPSTNVDYPVAMTVKTGDLTWQLDPLMDDQELDSRASSGTMYWEGATTVSSNGKPVGHGYLELTGYAQALKLDDGGNARGK